MKPTTGLIHSDQPAHYYEPDQGRFVFVGDCNLEIDTDGIE